jgi:hypothetical protein
VFERQAQHKTKKTSIMKAVKTYIVTFKSGRIERVFAYSIADLKEMINFDATVKIQKID